MRSHTAALPAAGSPLLVVVLGLGCDGPQSALEPAGRDAERIAELFGWMAGGGTLVWIAVLGSALYAVIRGEKRFSQRAARLFILGGGVITPTLLLTTLLAFGLATMPDLLHHGDAHVFPRVHVSGEQWWWRVRYVTPEGDTVELANELRLPTGQRTPLVLTSPDVIHSLWIPSLAGKTDMIPGRVTRMALEPTRTGTFRGACAEYCGLSHAHMQLVAVTMEPTAFEAWLAHQARAAEEPSSPTAARGAGLFDELGCGACHTIRGTEADGVIGPDLTHVGSRASLAAGALENDVPGFERWLAHTDRVKPGAHMPAFGMLTEDELRALATYLDGLR